MSEEKNTQAKDTQAKDTSQKDNIANLLKKNHEALEEILEVTRYTRRFVIWQQVFGSVKLVLIVIPIVLGVIYLPPIFKDLINQYRELLRL